MFFCLYMLYFCFCYNFVLVRKGRDTAQLPVLSVFIDIYTSQKAVTVELIKAMAYKTPGIKESNIQLEIDEFISLYNSFTGTTGTKESAMGCRQKMRMADLEQFFRINTLLFAY